MPKAQTDMNEPVLLQKHNEADIWQWLTTLAVQILRATLLHPHGPDLDPVIIELFTADLLILCALFSG